jgi:hypothetical protein
VAPVAMRQIKLPDWLWHFLIAINVFNFGFGFIIADRQLMLTALISGLCCYFACKLSKNGDTDE